MMFCDGIKFEKMLAKQETDESAQAKRVTMPSTEGSIIENGETISQWTPQRQSGV